APIILLLVSQTLVSTVSTELQSILRAIVGHGCLAAATSELSPTSHPGIGAVSSSIFQGGVLASGILALRLVDGAGSGIVRRGRISGGKKDGGGGGAKAISVMYASIGASSSAGTLSTQGAQAQECTLVHDPLTPWDQVHTLENVVPAPVTVWQPLHKYHNMYINYECI
ncbi:hypothetical protein Tco_0887047, partial [Tanacetum coccineum]